MKENSTQKRNKKKISEEDYQRKGKSLVALMKTRLLFLLIIHLLFTDGWKIEKTTADSDNLNKNLLVEKG